MSKWTNKHIYWYFQYYYNYSANPYRNLVLARKLANLMKILQVLQEQCTGNSCKVVILRNPARSCTSCTIFHPSCKTFSYWEEMNFFGCSIQLTLTNDRLDSTLGWWLTISNKWHNYLPWQQDYLRTYPFPYQYEWPPWQLGLFIRLYYVDDYILYCPFVSTEDIAVL